MRKNGREGEKVQYDSDGDGVNEEWIVIYDNGKNLEIASIQSKGNLVLGKDDTEAQNPGDIDKDGAENTDIDKAIYSYNNSVIRINNYCKSLVTKDDPNIIGVRCFGSDPDNPNYPTNGNSEMYKSDNLASWLDGKYNGIIKADYNNKDGYAWLNCRDYLRSMYLECELFNNQEFCLTPWREVDEGTDSIGFWILFDYSSYSGSGFIRIDSTGIRSEGARGAVRPVIKIRAEGI